MVSNSSNEYIALCVYTADGHHRRSSLNPRQSAATHYISTSSDEDESTRRRRHADSCGEVQRIQPPRLAAHPYFYRASLPRVSAVYWSKLFLIAIISCGNSHSHSHYQRYTQFRSHSHQIFENSRISFAIQTTALIIYTRCIISSVPKISCKS